MKLKKKYMEIEINWDFLVKKSMIERNLLRLCFFKVIYGIVNG